MIEVRSQRSGVSKSHTLSARLFALSFLGALLLALSFPANAQQPTKVPRIGFLTVSTLSTTPARYEAFLPLLPELGHVEGKNLVIQTRSEDGKLDRITALVSA